MADSSASDRILSVDSSTQSTKAIVWSLEGEVLSVGQQSIPIHSPGPQWIEHEAGDWWESTCAAIRESLREINPNRVRALGLTHQRETFVPLDNFNRPLRNAILWSDGRAAKQVQWVVENLGVDRIRSLTGKTPDLTPSLYKMLWLRDQEPSTFQSTAKFVDVHAYLTWKLTDRFVSSEGSADPTSLFDIRRKQWAGEILEACGLSEDQLPEVVAPGTVIGELTTGAANETGLPSGLPVVSGLGDGQCAALGSGVVKPGVASLNLGTASVLATYSGEYQVGEAFRTLIGGIPGSYVLESVLRGGAHTVTWFVDNFQHGSGRELGLDLSEEQLLEVAARKVPPGCEGLMTVPYWNSVMMPHWDPLARGITVGWSNDHTKAHFYRSILEGIAFEHRVHKRAMVESLGEPLEKIVVLGGGANSDLWCQIVADVMDSPLMGAQTTEATCLGAAILAASGVDLFPGPGEAAGAMVHTRPLFAPRGEQSQRYHRLFEQVYTDLYPGLQNALQSLNQLTS